MKKMLILLAACSMFALAASEDAVRRLFPEMKDAYLKMDGNKFMTFFHPEYTETHPDKSTASFDSIKEEAARLNAMCAVLLRGSAENSSLMDIMVAVFALNESDMSQELIGQIKKVENTPDGKKLTAEARTTLQEIHKLYLQKIEDIWKHCRIISVTVDGDKATVVYNFLYSGDDGKDVLRTIDAELVKVNGKWLLKKEVYRPQQ
jgi:hypothetical protein